MDLAGFRHGQSSSPTPPRPACLACRSIKVRCETEEESSSSCIRCTRQHIHCQRPAIPKRGRPKGSRNRQTPVERAVQVLDRETKRQRLTSPTPLTSINGSSAEPHFDIQQISSQQADSDRQSLNRAIQPAPPPTLAVLPHNTSHQRTSFHAFQPPSDPFISGISPQSLGSRSTHLADRPEEDDGGFSNPVRLLAEAAEEESHQAITSPAQPLIALPATLPPQYTLPNTLMAMLAEESGSHPRVTLQTNDLSYIAEGLEALLSEKALETLSAEDKSYFRPARAEVKRDLGPEYDPVSQALLTQKEVNVFFSSFFAKLHPLLPVLDPELHTPEFTQSRSAFLFTAICAHGAACTLGAEEATKRLRIHAQRLSQLISNRSFASVEIVQAFLLWMSWLPSSMPFQEERLWHETKYAINMAVELELGKPLAIDQHQRSKDPSFAACIENVDLSVTGVLDRLARNRERLWLHLFLWDSNLSLAFGKATRFAQDDLIRNETWCYHPLASQNDRITVACVALRRKLVALCDNLKSEIYVRSNSTSEWVPERVDEFLGPWESTWQAQCGHPPYLELMVRHTRLWSLSFALQALSVRWGDVTALRQACFTAALSSCEYICEQLRSSRSLWGFSNTMAPMLSVEALLAIRLYPPDAEQSISSRASVLGLLAQLSILLEKVGTTPPHRQGTSAVYGRHLQIYIRRRIIALCLFHHQRESQHDNPVLTAGRGSNAMMPQLSVDNSYFDSLFMSQAPSMPGSPATMNRMEEDSLLHFLDTTAGWTENFPNLFS